MTSNETTAEDDEMNATSSTTPHRPAGSALVGDLVCRQVPSPVGALMLVASDRGLRAVLWPDDHRYTTAGLEAAPSGHPVLDTAASQLAEYFEGERTEFDVPLDLVGTDFQVDVWRSLAEIPFGKTATYGEQARRIGRPRAFRAVGAANGQNPLSIVLPCHRVVGASGKLTGFAGGLDAKRWLLAHEAAEQRLL